MAQRIFVVDDSPMNIKAVEIALTAVGYEVVTARDGREALARVQAAQPDLIILDVQMPEINGYEVCRRLRRMPLFSSRPIMMLTANSSLHERVQGLEAGADDYMAKPFEPEELQARVKALLRRAVPVEHQIVAAQGKVIALFSLRGGIGVSTLAANLASGLAQLWATKTALVDMVFTGGNGGLLLNLPLRSTWADFADRSPEEIDGDMLDRVMLQHSSGVRLLAPATRPEDNELITAEKVVSVIGILRERYKYVVLDLPHDFRETTLAGLDAADHVLLLLGPEIASVCATTCAMDVFTQIGYGPEKYSLVMNATFERGGLARKEIEATLKRAIKAVIPFAGDLFTQALNRGIPPVLEMPTRPLGALLEDWSFSQSIEEDRKRPPERPSPALQRVLQRMQQRRSSRS